MEHFNWQFYCCEQIKTGKDKKNALHIVMFSFWFEK